MNPSGSERGHAIRKVYIVDDHPVFRRGISMLVNDHDDLTVCGESDSAATALAELAKAKPDVVLVDITLKDGDGLELTRNIKSLYPRLAVLAVSAHDESIYAERAIRAGAGGYVMKEENIDIVVSAIRKVLAGEIFLSEKMMPKLMEKLLRRGPSADGIAATPYDLLSDRELEVFQLIGRGLRTREIAEKLHLSPKTVQVYREHIKKKMHLKDAVELHHSAFQWAQNSKAD